jgi:hypothetical protein
METKQVFWTGTATHCDMCGERLLSIFIDGRTRHGPWGILCPPCHTTHGVGLGVGRGQRYQRQDTGRWLKVEG